MDEKVEQPSVVETAKKRYERARNFYNNPRQLALEDTRFALGDSDNGWQWPAEIYRARNNIQKKPCLTINVTAQHCNQIINNIRQNRPTARVVPVDGGADKKTAEILGGMIRSIQSNSAADTAHDLAAEHAIYGGEGYWRVITDYESYDSFNQEILIKCIPNPRLVFIDPDAKEPDRSDAKWGFVFDDISREECKELYPECDPASWAEDSRGWVTKDNIRIAEYFWCEYEDDVLFLLENGDSVLEGDLDDGAKIENGYISFGGIAVKILQKRPTKRQQWKWCKLIGGETKPVEERDWPGSYLPIVTVVGKELNIDGEIVRKGIVRDLKDPARMVNYSYSAAVETLALQNKVPYLAASEAVEGYEDIWGAANIENRAYLPFNAYNENGNPIPVPERQAPAVMPAAQVQMLQLSTEEMRAASGQQNANFGIRSEAQSGVGIQRLKVQGETATFHFPDNLVRALHYEAKVLIDLIPKVYDTKRIVRILGLDGNEDSAVLDPSLGEAHQEVDSDEVKAIFNPLVGKYDVAIDTGPSFQTQRQEAAAALTELATKNPQLMGVAGDLVVRSYDFPGADEIAKRIEKTIPPEVRGEEGKQNPEMAVQQMSQQLQQADTVIQNMQQHIDELEQVINGKLIEAQTKIQTSTIDANQRAEADEQRNTVEAFRAETDRLQALQPVIDPMALKPIIAQTLMEILQAPHPNDLIQDATQPELEPAEAGFFMPEQQVEGMPDGDNRNDYPA